MPKRTPAPGRHGQPGPREPRPPEPEPIFRRDRNGRWFVANLAQLSHPANYYLRRAGYLDPPPGRRYHHHPDRRGGPGPGDPGAPPR